MTLSPASSLYIIQPLATELQFCHSCGFIFKLLQSEGLEKVKSELSEFHLRHLLAANLQKLFQILLGNRQCSRSIHTLRKSVINGCVACSALLDSLPMEQQDLVSKSRRGWDLPVTVSLKTESGHKEEITNIKLRFSVRKEGIHRAVGRYISAQISVHTDHGAKPDDPMPLLARKTDDNITWTRAKEWLAECTKGEGHRHCRERITQRRLPKRLVFVSSDGNSIRLCLSNQIQSRSCFQYLALSHCWGGRSIPLIATRENLHSLLENIPYAKLSKTFQDAITITNRLGFQYIWIDSLCILQGDTDDWINEAAHMGSIYSGCFLNIVAADAPDSTVGCFFDRDLDTRFQVSHPLNGNKYSCLPSPFAYLSQTSVAGRGWCFQETFLAPRSLYFCKSQMFWECRRLQKCEMLQASLPWFPSPMRASVINWADKESPGKRYDEVMAYEWLKVVRAYSRTLVTYPKDKLIAFSGIARVFSQTMFYKKCADGSESGSEYLAGLWRTGIAFQLLWYVHPSARKPRSSSLRAPSWSWAAVDGAVGSILEDKDFLRIMEGLIPSCLQSVSIRDSEFKVLNCSTQLTTSDPYGEVKSGSLTVQCPVPKRIMLINRRLYLQNWRVRRCEVYLDFLPSRQHEVFMIPIWTTDYDDWGLLLEYVGVPGNYRRVGLYSEELNFPERHKVETVTFTTITIT